jgi:hypothetical protein
LRPRLRRSLRSTKTSFREAHTRLASGRSQWERRGTHTTRSDPCSRHTHRVKSQGRPRKTSSSQLITRTACRPRLPPSSLVPTSSAPGIRSSVPAGGRPTAPPAGADRSAGASRPVTEHNVRARATAPRSSRRWRAGGHTARCRQARPLIGRRGACRRARRAGSRRLRCTTSATRPRSRAPDSTRSTQRASYAAGGASGSSTSSRTALLRRPKQREVACSTSSTRPGGAVACGRRAHLLRPHDRRRRRAPITVPDRLADIAARYGADDPVSRAITRSRQELVDRSHAVESTLRSRSRR